MQSSCSSRLLHDVRYFESAHDGAAPRQFPPYAGNLFRIPEAAVAFGQRLGRIAEQSNISIGQATHLYLCFTTALPHGVLARTQLALAPWHEVLDFGLAMDFNLLSAAIRMSAVQEATFEALQAIVISGKENLPSLKHELLTAGEELKVIVRKKETAKYSVIVEQTIPAHPKRTEVFARIEHRQSGQVVSVKLGECMFYDEVPSLVDRIVLTNDILKVQSRKSFRGSIVASLNGELQDVDLHAKFDT